MICLLAESCAFPRQLANGYVIVIWRNRSPYDGRFPVKTKALVRCDRGFSRIGSEVRTCTTSGNWDNPGQSCQKRNANN